jgi:predicted  nucleic acid-binding Zn-ribbon protein
LTEITDDNQSFERWIRCGFKPILKGNTNLRREVAGDAQMPEREKKQHNKEKAVHKVTVAERAAVDRHFARREAKPSVRLKVSKNGSDASQTNERRSQAQHGADACESTLRR